MIENTDIGARALAELVRREWPQVVATLARVTGDLDLAEDAAQDAALDALAAWSQDPPRNPTAWIITTARRRAIDRIRREANGRRKAALLQRLEGWRLEVGQAVSVNDPAEIFAELETLLRDDQLRLIFGCCHPALGIDAQVALTLRSVAGLTTAEIAQAFLVAEPTMAQRIVRAKRKIATAAIPFVLPSDSELLSRLDQVHRVLYLVFNEGYAATSGEAFVRQSLCNEALRLVRLLVSLVPDDAETLGLASLMLSTHARAAARVDRDGIPVLLEEQDRVLWDQELISEADDLLTRSLRLAGRGGPLQLQAAIAMLHSRAMRAQDTDWTQIELLYRRLRERTPTAVVRLNHAVALAMAAGPQAGLDQIEADGLAQELDHYRYLHAARADLLARCGRVEQAREAYGRALSLPGSDPEQILLERKRSDLS